MNALLAFRRLLCGLVVVPCVVALAGCNRGPVMYRVKGTVHYKDGSVPTGALRIVQFQPLPDTTAQVKKGATAEIEPDGTFILTTRKPGDGAYQGEYAVTFNIRKGDFDPRPLVDQKYTRATTTPYSKVTVDHNIDDLQLEVEPFTGATGG